MKRNLTRPLKGKTKPMKTITEGAAIKRINRKLAHKREVLRTARGRWETNRSRHYVVDVNRNVVTALYVDVEELGRELGVIRNGERVAV